MMYQLPVTVKRSIELLGLVLLAFVIFQMQNIIMPIVLALVASIALSPIYSFLLRKKIPKIISIVSIIIFMLILLGFIVFFISTQLRPVIYDYANIKSNILNHVNVISKWLGEKTGISSAEQSDIIKHQTNVLLDSTGTFIKSAVSSISTTFIFFVLFPIYTFLILLYKDVLKKFLIMWFHVDETEKVITTLKSIESIINSYIIGLLMQFTYMTILLGVTLLLFGIEYALLIAVIFAILNLIPYVGAFIGNIIGILLTLSSSPDLSSVFTVLIVIMVVQFIDNNILMPSIVGSKVRINALSSLFAVIIGGSLAGISGMFLSIPIIASLKIAFDHSDDFKKWGVLFGDDKPRPKMLLKRKKAKVEKKVEGNVEAKDLDK